MFDNDAESVEDFESSMRISINKAISHIWNMYEWNFKERERTFRTQNGKAYYKKPDGQIKIQYISGEKKYGVRCENKYLDYISTPQILEEAKGTPTSFYLKNNQLYLYPTPDKQYSITVDFDLIPYALSADGEEKLELEEDEDYINIPEVYEKMFKNCVISKAMVYALADHSDENHSGYTQQFEEALEVLTKFCEGDGGLTEKRIIF